MAVTGSWRNLRSVMWVTLHVALVASLIRYCNVGRPPGTSSGIGVLITIAIASLVSWPITWIFLSLLEYREVETDWLCPHCRRGELRPLMRPGRGIFQPVSSYRCGGCASTVRSVEGRKVVEAAQVVERSANLSGIQFLDETTTEDEIRFLDEPSKSWD